MAEFLDQWILTAILLVPLVGALMIAMMNPRSHDSIHRAALIASFATFGFALAALRLFYNAVDTDGTFGWRTGEYLLTLRVPWFGAGTAASPLDFAYSVGVDGVSIWLLMLTALLTPLAIWGSFTGIRERVKEYYVLMLLLEVGMLGVFCARDLLLFYVFFEFTLIPLYFVIGIWGGPEKRRAASKFFIYTVAGSVLTFAAVLYLAFEAYRTPGIGRFTFDMHTLYRVGSALDPVVQRVLFVALAAGFAIKVPLFPFHTWLPLAHTEAPTAGSVLLAGVLLKLGTYGFLRLSLPMLPAASISLAPIAAALAIAGIIYGALVAWVQTDVKKLVAYSSVSHLGFCILGMFSLKMAGLTGSLLYMVNHGLSTGALFLVVGMMYERYHTRRIDEIGGLARRMPWLAFFLVFFTLSSIALPGLNGFVGEFLVLLGTFSSHETFDGNPAGPLGMPYAVLASTGIILGAVYMLWMCQRVLFGPLREPPGTPDTSLGLTPDLTPREIMILTPIALVCLWIGVWPRAVIDSMQPALQAQIAAHVNGTGAAGLAEEGGAPWLLSGADGAAAASAPRADAAAPAVRSAAPDAGQSAAPGTPVMRSTEPREFSAASAGASASDSRTPPRAGAEPSAAMSLVVDGEPDAGGAS